MVSLCSVGCIMAAYHSMCRPLRVLWSLTAPECRIGIAQIRWKFPIGAVVASCKSRLQFCTPNFAIARRLRLYSKLWAQNSGTQNFNKNPNKSQFLECNSWWFFNSSPMFRLDASVRDWFCLDSVPSSLSALPNKAVTDHKSTACSAPRTCIKEIVPLLLITVLSPGYGVRARTMERRRRSQRLRKGREHNARPRISGEKVEIIRTQRWKN